MTRFVVRVEYVPEASFAGIEWGWEAVITNKADSWSIGSKLGYDSIELARENMNDVLAGYLPALAQDRVETFTREI